MDKIVLENGKYEITFNELEGEFNCKKYGEEWMKFSSTNNGGSKMLIAWFYEMVELQENFDLITSSLNDGVDHALESLERYGK